MGNISCTLLDSMYYTFDICVKIWLKHVWLTYCGPIRIFPHLRQPKRKEEKKIVLPLEAAPYPGSYTQTVTAQSYQLCVTSPGNTSKGCQFQNCKLPFIFKDVQNSLRNFMSLIQTFSAPLQGHRCFIWIFPLKKCASPCDFLNPSVVC